MSERSKNLFHNINHNWFLGKNSLYIFISVYLVLWLLSSFYTDSIVFSYMFVFYFCGTFIVGPATTIFAYLYVHFIEMDLIAEPLIWIGFPFSFLIPGSVVNGGIYFGVLVDGVRGMILAAICLYLPCFAALYGMLPQWKYYRSKPGVQRLTKGLTCVSTGILMGMVHF
jgi:chromate transporter